MRLVALGIGGPSHGLAVQSVSWADKYGPVSTIESVQETGTDIAQIQGASGGPVISLTNTGASQVRAAGMIQGFLGTGRVGAVRGPVHSAGSNQCSGNVLFTSMRTVVESIGGALLLTG